MKKTSKVGNNQKNKTKKVSGPISVKKASKRTKNLNKVDVNKALKSKIMEIVNPRPTWDEYFVEIMKTVGTRSTCDRGRLGCVIVKDRRIISTGYSGSPAGCKHCDEAGHEMHTVIQEDGTESRHCIRTSHAEQNAIAQAAKVGVSTDESTLYIKMTPCYTCAKMIINAGIKRVVALNDYHAGNRTREIFKEAGIEYELLNDEMEAYADTGKK